MSTNNTLYAHEYITSRYAKRKQMALNLLGNKCSICAGTTNLKVCKKDSTLSSKAISFIWNTTDESFLSALNSFEVLCKSCRALKLTLARVYKPKIHKISKPKLSIEERLFSKVDKHGSIPLHNPDLGNCWLWTGAKRNEYGCIRFNGKLIDTHVVSFIVSFGYTPVGIVMHECDTKLCIRPTHLKDGTYSQNMRDAIQRGLHPGTRKGHKRPLVHGTMYGYRQYNCRCSECRKACAEDQARYRLIHGR